MTVPILTRITAAAIIALLSIATHAQAPTSGSSTVAGKVVSPDGRALRGAAIQLNDIRSRRPVLSTESDAEGRFRFLQVPAGKFSLTGSERGYLSAAYQQHEQFSTAIVTGTVIPTDALILQLTPLALISGRVFDEAGDPVRDANILLFYENRDNGETRIVQTGGANTDDLGAYELANLQPGRYFVAVQAQPWYAVHPRHAPNAASGSVDPALDVAYPLTFYPAVTRSDEATPLTLKGGERLLIDLHLSPLPAVTLSLPLLAGSPAGSLPGASQSRQPPHLEQNIFGSNRSVPLGQMEYTERGLLISGLPPGQYRLMQPGDPNGRSTTTLPVDLTSGSLALASAQGSPSASLTLSVRDGSGAPLPEDAQVFLRSGSNSPPVQAALGKEGRAELRDLSPGQYRLVIFAGGRTYHPVRSLLNGKSFTGSSLPVAAGDILSADLTVSAAVTNIEGLAKRDSGGNGGAMIVLIPLVGVDAAASAAEGGPEPAAGVANDLTHSNVPVSRETERFRRDQSDLDGTFTLQQVIPGKYMLVAIEDGWTLNWTDPSALAPYLREGLSLTIPDNAVTTLKLPTPIPIQPR